MGIKKNIAFIVLLVFASLTYAFSGGNGTLENPYKISTRADLEAVNNYLDAHYILMNDIDLAGIIYTKAVIAPDTSTSNQFQGTKFTGTFDGNGFEIKNLIISDTVGVIEQYNGLFGCIDKDGEIYNLGLKDCDVSGYMYVGGLAGSNDGTIINCQAIGLVQGGYTSNGQTFGVYLGGLVGDNNGMISDSYAAVNVDGVHYIGGLVGASYSGSISNCYSTGSATGETYVGGLAGWNSVGNIANCYSTGTVIGEDIVGGLVGYNLNSSIVKCYFAGSVIGNYRVGGLVGDNLGNTIGSFWNTQTAGLSYSAGSTGKTTAQMQDISTFLFAGWDFVGETDNGTDYIWYMEPGGYPRLNGVGSDGSGVDVEGLIVAAKRRVGRTVFEYDVVVKVKNMGADISGAELRLVGFPANVKVLNDEPLTTAFMAHGSENFCTGILTLEIDRSIYTDTDRITWHAITQSTTDVQSMEMITSDINLTTFAADGIGQAELYEIANSWLWPGLADVNGDGIVNYQDLAILPGPTR